MSLFTRQYRDLSPELRLLALRNQKLQGNPEDDTKQICELQIGGGFDWETSIEGGQFWSDLFNGKKVEIPNTTYEIY